MVIAVDFDGTCVNHEYPEVGRDIGAIPVLKSLVNAGHSLILYTMRSNKSLEEAVAWFIDNEIPLYGINKYPMQHTWTNSPKCYAELYIDDAALGIPLLQDFTANHTGDTIHTTWAEHISYRDVKQLIGRPYVDWNRVFELLILKGLL